MTTLTIYNRQGGEVGTCQVDTEAIAPRINRQLLHDVVVMYEANRRQGFFATKTRGEVAGTTKKMYRQKGTGNARAGSRRSGVRRGGGHIFAKRPRDFSYRYPRKAVKLATRMAIASKIIDDQMKVLDEFSLTAPATREVAAALKALGLQGRQVLFVLPDYDQVVYRSGRNVPGVSVLPVRELNALEVLRPHCLVVTKAALDVMCQPAAAGVAEESTN